MSESDGIMFFGSLDSHIYGVDINTGRQTWKFPTMNMLDSSPAIASNMMLLGSRDGLLYIFGSEITPTYIIRPRFMTILNLEKQKSGSAVCIQFQPLLA
jgi:hypothetical protein